MDGIDPEKALAALEAEKERRLQAKVDAGELVVQTVTVVCSRDEDVEEVTARALAKHPVSESVHYKLCYIFTGVPRDPDHWKESPPVQTVSEEGPPLPSPETAGSGAAIPSVLSQPTPTYVRVILRNGNNGDPGQIAEAFWSVEDGAVVLTDLNDKHITSRALLKGEDPSVLAKSLLRERAPDSFSRPIHYPNLGVA
jgi:hypothetical protein